MLLGALGMANMWAAVFADVGVALLAILNATRSAEAAWVLSSPRDLIRSGDGRAPASPGRFRRSSSRFVAISAGTR